MLHRFLASLFTLLRLSIVAHCYTNVMDMCVVTPKAISESETTTDWTAMTPSESTLGDINSREVVTSVPWPGNTFIITTTESPERVITFVDGLIVLAPPGGRGSIRWDCIENKGWLGFRDPVSGRYLGHDKHGKLWCVVDKHDEWERFSARHKPEGGYVLLMKHWEKLLPVKVAQDGGKEIWRTETDGGDGTVWRFIKC